VQPEVGLGFVLRLVEMIEGFMGVLNGAKRALDLALGPGGGVVLGVTRRSMGLPGDPQVGHDALEHPALGNGAIVEIEKLGSALEQKVRIGLGRHGVEEKTQGRCGLFAVNAPVFLVTHPTAVIDDAEQHQGGWASARFTPQGRRHPLQIRR
jgi:hypothetical protein